MKKIIVIAALLFASTARAEQITTGSLNVSQFGTGALSMSGSSFSFDGTVSSNDGYFRSWATVRDHEPVALDGYFVGTGVRGIANVEGRALTLGKMESNDWMSISFSSSAFAPEITESTTPGYETTVMAPFFFEGRLAYLKDPTTWEVGLLDLLGYGQATLYLRANFVGGPPVWDFTGMRYDFTPAHAPEPMTLVLFGSGLLGLLARKRLCRS